MTLADPAAIPEGLTWCSDEHPGLKRTASGKGFAYHDAQGRLIRDGKVLARIRALAIPPAWTDVWICPREIRQPLEFALRGVAAPVGVVAVLLPPLHVPPGRLDMPRRPRTDPHIRPGRRDGQGPDAGQHLPVADQPPLRVVIGEPLARRRPLQPRMLVAAPGQALGDGGGVGERHPCASRNRARSPSIQSRPASPPHSCQAM